LLYIKNSPTEIAIYVREKRKEMERKERKMGLPWRKDFSIMSRSEKEVGGVESGVIA